MANTRNTAVRGAVAGLLAAAALVLFFFIVDTMEGVPLRTPAFLASVLFGAEEIRFGFAFIASYTVLHFVAFAIIGVAVAFILEKSHTAPMFLLGVVLGFLLFDLVFYASLALTGVDVVNALGWPEFLMGNFIAGVVLMSYLHLTGPERTVGWLEMLQQHRILRDAIFVGLLGAVAVAVWFLIIDAVMGRLFFTPGALGSVLFAGARNAADVQVTGATVLGYTIVHVIAFLAAGLVVSILACEAEEHPPLVLAAGLLFVTFETLFIGVLAIAASWLLDMLQWWTIALGNLIAAAAMGWYMWREHPKLRTVVLSELEDVEEIYGDTHDSETVASDRGRPAG